MIGVEIALTIAVAGLWIVVLLHFYSIDETEKRIKELEDKLK